LFTTPVGTFYALHFEMRQLSLNFAEEIKNHPLPFEPNSKSEVKNR
jgi:hypothetical protein